MNQLKQKDLDREMKMKTIGFNHASINNLFSVSENIRKRYSIELKISNAFNDKQFN